MFWRITSFPRCEYHVFLSHCSADKADLVLPVHEELKRRGIIPWLDREDYYYGRESRTALRDGLLQARHIVYFITRQMMKYQRGWCQMELAYSDLLQRNLDGGGRPLLDFEIPLFFLDRTKAKLDRTVWGALRDRGIFCSPEDAEPVTWAVDQIMKFLRHEEELSKQMLNIIVPGTPLHNELGERPGAVERVTRFYPRPLG